MRALQGRAAASLQRAQQNHRWVAAAVALLRKYNEDGGSHLAALIAYWAFFSLFPLLLVFVTVLAFVLHGNPAAQTAVLHSALENYPIIGPELAKNIHRLNGSAISLTVGLGGTLFAGLGVTGAVQNAFDQAWSVPRTERATFFRWRLRGLLQLATLGLLLLAATGVAGAVAGAGPHNAFKVLAGVLIALLLNLSLFFTSFRIYSPRQVSNRELLPGVVVGALTWQALEHLGGIYVTHVIRHAAATAGVFALVLGLLVWFYLGGRLLVLMVELDVVLARKGY